MGVLQNQRRRSIRKELDKFAWRGMTTDGTSLNFSDFGRLCGALNRISQMFARKLPDMQRTICILSVTARHAVGKRSRSASKMIRYRPIDGQKELHGVLGSQLLVRDHYYSGSGAGQ